MTAFYPVIPAGGSGTRLWPLSRRSRPKFLHPLLGTDSLLQVTAARLAPLVGAGALLVVTGTDHATAVRAQLPGLAATDLLVEPAPRESAPAIALAAAVLATRDPDAMMGSFAADHRVRDVPAFQATVRTAIEVARWGLLVTVGITPDRPETGYGYIRTGAPLGIGAAAAVDSFVEKPDRATAQGYLASGGYLWNAGMFVWSVRTVLDELAEQVPELHAGVRRIAAAYDAGDGPAVLAQVWPTLPRISIDHAIMEPAAGRGRVACVPGDFGWTDLGDWDALGAANATDTDTDANAVTGDTIVTDSRRCVVAAGSGRTVVVLGADDLVVVDTGDVILVCPRSRAQDVGGIVRRLDAAGRSELT